MRRCSCCRLQSWKWNPCQLRWARCCGVWVVRAVARRSVDPFYTLYFFFTERKKENTEIQNLAQVQRSPPRDRECIPKRTSRDLGKFLDFWMGHLLLLPSRYGTRNASQPCGRGRGTALIPSILFISSLQREKKKIQKYRILPRFKEVLLGTENAYLRGLLGTWANFWISG